MKRIRKSLGFLIIACAGANSLAAQATPIQSVTTSTVAAHHQKHALYVDMDQIRSDFSDPMQISMNYPYPLQSRAADLVEIDGSHQWALTITVPGADAIGVRMRGKIGAEDRIEFANSDGTYFTYSGSQGEIFRISAPFSGEATITVHVYVADAALYELDILGLMIATDNPLATPPQRGLGESADESPGYKSTYEHSNVPASCLNDEGHILNTEACRDHAIVPASCVLDANTYRGMRTAVGIVINRPNSSGFCSGTLVNNIKEDGKNYILTAEHCAGLTPASGFDYADLDFNVHWDRVDACESTSRPFTSIPGGPVSTNYYVASVVDYVDNPIMNLRHQHPTYYADTMLLYSNNPVPSGANPIWAGWDATHYPGVDFNAGVYAPVTSMGPKVEDFTYLYNFGHPKVRGLAFAETSHVYLGGLNLNTYGAWRTNIHAEGLGTVTFGSSGSGLMNQDHRLIGVAAATFVDSGPLRGEVFSRFGFAWDPILNGVSPYVSKGDLYRGVGHHLDPDNTGVRVWDSREDLSRPDNITNYMFIKRRNASKVGDPITIEYVMENAIACQASSTPVHADWNGNIPVVNGAVQSRTVTTLDNNNSYTLRCQNASGTSRSRTWPVNGLVGQSLAPIEEEEEEEEDLPGVGTPVDGGSGSSGGAFSTAWIFLLLYLAGCGAILRRRAAALAGQ